jgi:hypothetical protein
LQEVDLRSSKIAFAAGVQLLSGFNRVFKKLFGKSRMSISQLIEIENGAKSNIALEACVVFAEKMRSHDFVFLAILVIRVAFEANSMDPR